MPFTQPEYPPTSPVLHMSADVEYFNKRLAEMGLTTPELVDSYGILLAPHTRLADYGITAAKLVHERSAIMFPYLDHLGNKLANGMWQARLIGTYPDFVAQSAGITREEHEKLLKKRWPKYMGSKGFDLYFPRFAIPWYELKHVFITEGIPKAIRACQAGIPCLSIQGKDQFRIKNTNQFVPGLEALLENGQVEKITYVADSDAAANPDIRNSATLLVGLLNGRKMDARDFAEFLILPALPQCEKTGLDDYLNIEGTQSFAQNFVKWINPWEGGRYFELVDKLNDMLVWIRGSGNYVDRPMRQVLSSGVANTLVAPLISNAGLLVNPYNGATIRNGQGSLNNTFDKNPFRTTAQQIDFWPGMPEWVDLTRSNDGEDEESLKIYNLWEDWAPRPEAGDVSPFIALLAYAVPDPLSRELLLQIVSHRIQFPEQKSPLAVFTYGGEGTGKTCIATALSRAITRNDRYIHIGGLNPTNSHEDNHLGKQFVCMEEPPEGISKREVENLLKLYVDSDELTCNPKGVKQYKIRNRMLFWINTNEHVAPFSGAARRWLVLKSPEQANPILAKACWDWMQSTLNFGGILRQYILDTYPNPVTYDIQQAAFKVEAKAEMIRENMDSAVVEYEDFLSEMPQELLDSGLIPTRLMNLLPPYNSKTTGQRQSFSRTLSKSYPLAWVGNSKDGKVLIADGITCTFRSTVKNVQVTTEATPLKVLYRRWESHPALRSLYSPKFG
jgi:hypothetical protein